MKSRLWILVLGMLLALGLAGCKSKNTEQDEAISELATQEADNESLTEDLAEEVQKAKDMVIELRKEFEARMSPEKVLEETNNWGTTVVYQCDREIPGYGVRSVFLLGNGIRAFCMEPHKGPPMFKCLKKAGTDYWICDDGRVQILKECLNCGCESTPVPPTAVPPTGAPATATPQPCCTTEPPTVAPTATPTTGTCVPCTRVPPTVEPTPILPTVAPTPYGTATCAPTEAINPECDTEPLDLNFVAKLNSDDFGTQLGGGTKFPSWSPSNIREEVRVCQIHVVNMYQLVLDRTNGNTAGTEKDGNCIVGYARGVDDNYHQVDYIGRIGESFHIESRLVGFGLNEGVAQMVLSLERVKNRDGSWACRRPGDPKRPGAKDISFVELGMN